MKRHKDWLEIEDETNNLVSALTYVILFMNDQVYNHILILEEVLKLFLGMVGFPEEEYEIENA